MYVEENKPLAPFTTFGIGGPARWFAEARNEQDIAEAAAWARTRNTPIFILGGGSNLLVSDAGFDGLVVYIALTGIETSERGGKRIYRTAAGENWDLFVQTTVAEDCAGVECLTAIPGTVGGTPVQNVGAYGQEVASSIVCVRAYDLKETRFVEFSAADCRFAYRRSRFNTDDAGRYIVTRVDYALDPAGPPTLRYADLQREFSGRPAPGVAEVADAVRRIRHSKGMVLVPGESDSCSAGSFFKNPIVGKEAIAHVAAVAGKEPPSFPAGPEAAPDCVKLPAAWLIEQAGFARGYTQGQAAISSRHTLALVNRGAATASEILDLAATITSAVQKKFRIQLEREPVLLGFGS